MCSRGFFYVLPKFLSIYLCPHRLLMANWDVPPQGFFFWPQDHDQPEYNQPRGAGNYPYSTPQPPEDSELVDAHPLGRTAPRRVLQCSRCLLKIGLMLPTVVTALIIPPYIFQPIPASLPNSPNSIFWNYSPNKQFAVKSLCDDLLLRNSNQGPGVSTCEK